jgi:nitrogen-specific signal transduction histidine kinase
MIVSAATVHDDQGLPMGTVVIFNDVTDRRQLQEHLNHAMKMEAIGELAGGVAHDFNNLLCVILTEAQLLRMNSGEGSEDHEGAMIIETAAQRASELTTQLLGFARRGKHRVVPVDVHVAIYETAQLLSRTLNKNIRLTLDLQADTSTVMGDPGQLQQVLLNLAINARDAMPDGGDLTFSTRPIGDGYRPDVPHLDLLSASHLELSVRDTGCGIPVDIQRRIFDPFFTTHEKGKGSGMGLATAYGIVNGHHGAITVDSTEGRGSTFNVYLPLSEEECLRSETQDSDLAAKLNTGSGRILLVDDEVMFRDVSSSALKRFGYEVVTAEDGAQAVNHYRQNHKKTDLVLLDMIMPTMNGLTCFQHLKQINPEVKVILVSGYAINGEVQEALDSGARGFVQKPFKIEKLVQEIRKTLAA